MDRRVGALFRPEYRACEDSGHAGLTVFLPKAALAPGMQLLMHSLLPHLGSSWA